MVQVQVPKTISFSESDLSICMTTFASAPQLKVRRPYEDITVQTRVPTNIKIMKCREVERCHDYVLERQSRTIQAMLCRGAIQCFYGAMIFAMTK